MVVPYQLCIETIKFYDFQYFSFEETAMKSEKDESLSVVLDPDFWCEAPAQLPDQDQFVVIYITAARAPQIAIYSDKFNGWALVKIGKKNIGFTVYEEAQAVVYWSPFPMNKIGYEKAIRVG